jgi:hypothetical protein
MQSQEELSSSPFSCAPVLELELELLPELSLLVLSLFRP